MKIELKNIGMLEKASVKLEGLTVIAGENDTGKSTVGKIIFCIIKAINRYEEDFQESREYKIQERLDRLFFHIRRNIDLRHTEEVSYHIQDVFSIDYFFAHESNLDIYFSDLRKEITNLVNIDDSVFLRIEDMVTELEFVVRSPEDKQKSIENALNKVFRSEFNSNILHYNHKIGYIKLYDGDLLLLDIEIINNKVVLKNEVQPIEIEEATFIETPLILNHHDLLMRSQTGLDITKRSSRRLGVPYTTLHTKDLFDKLKALEFTLYFNTDFENTIKDIISDTINGEIIYDSDEKDFIYIKSDNKISIKNTATGIKAFGILQLLIDSGLINRTSMLILDEPEIHLHPKWQLLYAQIISILVKNDIPVLVTSHSPYMIEALKRYSDRDGASNKTNFYLSCEDVIEDENNLPAIFKVLSEPFEVFQKMDLEDMKDK